MIARSVPAPANHHRGSYTSPALATASYPFVDLPPGNTLRRKLFPSSKFYNRPLYFSETMRYNEVNDKLEFVFAFILGILSVVLKKKHTQFPDFRVGYHNKKIMENKENWDYANNVAGNLCALFAVIGIIVSVILYLLKANMNITIIIFFIYTIAAILAILVLPVKLIKK